MRWEKGFGEGGIEWWKGGGGGCRGERVVLGGGW